jgi:hypothetical protein
MIHPSTELRLVNPHVGYGVFASAPIPKGSLVYVQDSLDIEITPERYESLDEASRQLAEKYAFVDARGIRIVSWDSAKYVNHSCNPNTMSTAWGFEIALRDIAPGEQITDEYGLFNLEWDMECCCGHHGCRGLVTGSDAELLYRNWDRSVRSAMAEIPNAPQPLLDFVDPNTKISLEQYLTGVSRYRSVRSLLRKASKRALAS